MISFSDVAALWDLDGTLVDTAELHFQAWVELAEQLRLPFTREQFSLTFGRRNPDILHFLFGDHLTEAEVIELGERKEELYRAKAQHGVTVLPGVHALLAEAHARGIRQAIGSSAPRVNIELLLEITDTRRFFDAIVSAEDTARGKPDPEVFLIGGRKLNTPPARCVVLEDAVAGVEAARAAGMKCIAVTYVGHHPPEKLQAAGATLVVPTLEAVSADTIRGLVQ